MIKQTREKDLALFVDIAKLQRRLFRQREFFRSELSASFGKKPREQSAEPAPHRGNGDESGEKNGEERQQTAKCGIHEWGG